MNEHDLASSESESNLAEAADVDSSGHQRSQKQDEPCKRIYTLMEELGIKGEYEEIKAKSLLVDNLMKSLPLSSQQYASNLKKQILDL